MQLKLESRGDLRMRDKDISQSNIMTKVFNEMLFIQIMAVITATIGSVVDGVITSNFLGRDAMAAFSISMPFFIFLSCFSNMVGNGAQSLSGKLLGKGEKESVNGLFSLTIISICIFGLIVFILAFLFDNQIAVLLGADAQTKEDVAAYIRGLSFGALPIMLNGPIIRFLQLDKAQKFSFLGVIVMTVTNISGDLLNVFVFKKGMFGMAFATSVGYYAAVILLVTHFFSSKSELTFALAKAKFKDLKDIIIIGLPTAISQICVALRSLCLNRIFLTLSGTLFVAAYAGQNTVSTLLDSVSLGFGMTTLLISSVLVGEEDRTSLTKTVKESLKTSLLINVTIAVLVIIGADFLASLFSKGDLETRNISARILRIYACGLPISVVIINLQNFFQSIKKTFLVNAICVLHDFVFVVGYALLLPRIAGKDTVWFLFPAAQVTTLLLIVIISIAHNKGIPKSFEEFLMLDEGFGVSAENRLDISISDLKGVIGVSEAVHNFCRSHQMDKTKSFFAALSIEEMAGNIVLHGFEKDKKNIIELRVAIKDDRIKIRIRDNCKNFNPEDHIRNLTDEDMTHNIGIRLISKRAENFKYQSTFNLNVLTIIL